MDFDPFYSLQYDNEKAKANHRRSRKSVRKDKLDGNLQILPKGAKSYGKKNLHRYNRRNWNASENYHKHDAFSFSSLYWYFS